jgi:hypothetical protein
MVGFTRMMTRLNNDKEFGFHPKCKKLSLSHLCLADDLMLFLYGNITSKQKILGIFEESSKLSGLEANFNKSQIFLAGLSIEEKAEITRSIKIKEGILPVRCLGVPLLSGRQSKAHCYTLSNKITGRLEGWSYRTISYAGRVQIVNLLSSQCKYIGQTSSFCVISGGVSLKYM